MDRFRISQGRLAATIRAEGAELCSLIDADVGEMLWQTGAAWDGQAPVLFPIVGKLPDNTLRHQGQTYTLPQHGVARISRFAWVTTEPDRCTLVLVDNAETREMFPFAFRFEISFAIEADWLVVSHTATNTGDATLPVNLGGHPAFRWPLADGVAKDAHWLAFESDEPALVPRLNHRGLRGPAVHPSGIVDGVMKLSESIFTTGAVILTAPTSRSVVFRGPGTPGIEMRWEGLPNFGIWMRPPGDFLCLEPWLGMAAEEGWDAEILERPGAVLLAPGAQLTASYRVRVLAAEPA